MEKYYNGTKLLSLSDINGNKPEIYICTTNRTGGKTTYFNRLLVNSFIKRNEKFCLVYRFNYELDDISDKFFKDIRTLFFKDYYMRSERKAKGIYHELFLCQNSDEQGKSCGYAISLNSADQLKKYSHLFSDVSKMLFDEFQSETNRYCTDEIRKFLSVHTSIARGHGKQTRYVPVYMISNPVSIINPYYVAMGISNRLKSDTQFLRGDGFVLEQGYVESASKALKESAFNRAFANHEYTEYAAQAIYLNDNQAFIDKPDGKSRYLGTIKYHNKHYGIREFPNDGIIYCDNRPDMSYPYKIAITTEEHDINYIILNRNDVFITNMRFFFNKGCFRFRDLSCKEALLALISY